MAATDDELDWLADRWPYFRDTVRAAVMRHVAPVMASIAEDGAVDEASWDSFVRAVLREFAEARAGRERLYSTALSFFGDTAPLRRALEEAGSDLVGEQGPAIRMVAVKRGLTRMRDIWIAGSAHRGKTWSRLDSISRELARTAKRDLGIGGRCTFEHFEELLAHLREHHVTDRNLPRTLAGIEDYFHEFCPDCRDVSMPEGLDIAAPEDGSDDDDMAAALEGCLGELPSEPRDFVLVHYKMTDPVEFSTSGYCQRNGLDRRRFHRVLDRALELLRECLDGKISAGAI